MRKEGGGGGVGVGVGMAVCLVANSVCPYSLSFFFGVVVYMCSFFLIILIRGRKGNGGMTS